MIKLFLRTIGLAGITLLGSIGTAQGPDAATLDSVLQKMDTAAASFQTTQADFVWDQYQRVVDETDTQKGTVYYRRSGKEIEMMADIKEPEQKFLLYKDGKLQVYQPKIEQVIQYTAGANHNEIESYLVLGFGGSGQDLKNSFDVTYQGEETVDNMATAKLHLTPKSEKVRSYFTEAFLWIDLNRGISLQQKFMQSQGDYRLAKYSAVKVNAKISNDVFRLKTTGKTKFVSPRG
ncbi:MAG TPA: outer membrane lipoprotein carrier protein LolA [Candidatus Polarisedimenticolia bacterium]|nr:outer membrane lipoprotein carrier protein LolA [Candidatus Polarisedimenticolia bacterium]